MISPSGVNADSAEFGEFASAWLHGLAMARANRTTVSASVDAVWPSRYAEVMHRVHGPVGAWNTTLEADINRLRLPLGDAFEYDRLRGCRFWDPMTCYTAPSWINALVRNATTDSPLFALEVGPFLGSVSIALANALVYQQRSDGFVLAVDTFRSTEGFVGIRTQLESYTPPLGVGRVYLHPEKEENFHYYAYMRNVATAHVSQGGAVGQWVPKTMQHKPVENATKKVVPMSLKAPKFKSNAHWLGRKGWRPTLIYLNAPRVGADYKRELDLSWKLLACGGTIAGDGYHIPGVTRALKELAAKRKGVLEAYFVRAPGTRYEVSWAWQDTNEFQERIAFYNMANFTVWKVNKPCKQEQDDELGMAALETPMPADYIDSME